jgi:hypothetical protein
MIWNLGSKCHVLQMSVVEMQGLLCNEVVRW